MKTKSIIEFKKEIEGWVDFNTNTPITLLDLSKLMFIIGNYYLVNLKKIHKDNKETSQKQRKMK